MHDHTPDPPFPDACRTGRTGRIEDIDDDGRIVSADGTGRPIRWQGDREDR